MMFTRDTLERRRGRYDRRTPASTIPHCGCCGLECAVVHGEPVLRCVCGASLNTCSFCCRGACHCRCRRPAPLVVNMPLRRLL